MGANALKSHGTIVARQAGGVGAFVDIGEVVDVTPPPMTGNTFEALSQTDTHQYYVKSSVKRTGDFTFGINFNPTYASHDHVAGLQYSYDNDMLDGWRITYPDADASTLIFSGYVTNIAPMAPVDGILTASVTIRPTGPWAHDN